MNDNTIFERNMLAIASRHGTLCADRIRASRPDPHIGIAEAKSGAPVPYLERDGRKAFMHSRFDPEREASQLAAEYSRVGFYVFLGLGAGYGAAALLAAGRVTKGIVVEYGAPALRAILERVDLTHILADRRLLLLIDPTDEELTSILVSSYVPTLTGDLVSVPLRGRIDAAPAPYQRATELVLGVIGTISDDYSVQAFFGKRWFSNIIKNLPLAASPTPPVGPIREAMVTAAGPSLELFFDEIRDRPKGSFLIATDTSLRAVLERGILPDAVVSIDCQHISYYHFSLGLPDSTPLFIDLASPPTVARLAKRPYFFSSGHPLSRYVKSHFRPFPDLDTSGGNVTHAAVSLADFLGASTVRLYGADFSYPYGKSYARGTYIYPYFDVRQSRLRPFEGLFADFLYRNQSLDREDDEEGCFRYVTKPLVAYKERLERLSDGLSCRLERCKGMGVYVRDARREPSWPRQGNNVFASGRARMKPEEFLSSYLRGIEALPEPNRSAVGYLDALSADDKDLWTTMLPSAAAFRRELGDESSPSEDILSMTRSWCASVVRAELGLD